jgi:hypothetical protein
VQSWPPSLSPDNFSESSTGSITDSRLSIVQLDDTTQLHQAVLSALWTNCLLQIEDVVSRYSLRHENGLAVETTASRVDYESVLALHNMMGVCAWLEEHVSTDSLGGQRALVDLAPAILRDIFAGLSTWACYRGIQLVKEGCMCRPQDRRKHEVGENPVRNYKDASGFFRDTVAKAISHSDTAAIVERLDSQLQKLEFVRCVNDEVPG